ncbi:MAG: DeoR/GlpR family DNA-binding transcription regulator [Victivallaceae bacterium]|nr:DeoR/GlpR family DNA-binding transcription regulator [Victivallaceae bacterium]
MKKEETRIQMLNRMLREKESVTLEEAVKALAVSEATARRLFIKLEQEGQLLRTHGAVRLHQAFLSEYSYRLSESTRAEEKKRIGCCAAQQIQDAENLFLDSGTTVMHFAVAIAKRLQMKELHDVRIVTNSLVCIDLLAELCPVRALGGMVRASRHDICGPVSERELQNYSFDRAILGADAVALNGALMTTDESTAALNALAAMRSCHVMVLCDSSKYNRSALVQYAVAEKERFSFFTDKGLSEQIARRLRELGFSLVQA